MTDISRIIGRTPVRISIPQREDEIIFIFSDGSVGKFLHWQDCCESVSIEEVAGDWADLIGHPLLVASERTQDNHEGPAGEGLIGWDSDTWTFYTFRSIAGTVDVRWCGSSNGYYSESVDFELTEKEIR